MTNVLLCCSAGMSTSLLVNKMKKFCQDNNLDFNIWAISSDKISQEIQKDIDIILLGPQVKYMKDEVISELNKISKNLPVEVINIMDYGTMRGDNVVNFVKNILKIGE